MHPAQHPTKIALVFFSCFLLTTFKTASADWNPGDNFKMHFPQLPDPEGWDICLVDQWIADDFECTESGPINDIHFWISWREDVEGPIDDFTFEVNIFRDAGGMPGPQLWQLGPPGSATITVRPYGQGFQGWNCPSTPFIHTNDHFAFYQVNITNILEPFQQIEGEIYWLVIRANPTPIGVVGWKTSGNDPPTPTSNPHFGSWALWSTDLLNWQFVQSQIFLHDMAFVITNDGGQPQEREYGDAPENAIAYPSLGVIGAFPTCRNVPLAGYIEHNNFGAWFGMGFDFELDGNAGFCPTFTPNLYDQDECFDPMTLVDAGLLIPEPFTIVGPAGAESVVPCPNSNGTPLGPPCTLVPWGGAIDIHVHNTMPNATIGWVNVLVDWNQDGVWSGSSPCPGGQTAPEHILVNHLIPNPYDGPLSGLNPLPFLIGPRTGYVWVRFSITEQQVPAGWDGSGIFEDGETEDYLLWVEGEHPDEFEFGDAPEDAPAYPWMGVLGAFPTCVLGGPSGFIQHSNAGGAWFGQSLDFEVEGNASLCPTFTPNLYDQDECFQDGDAGLILPEAFTIQNALPVPCPNFNGSPLGFPCTNASWGANIDIEAHNHMPATSQAFVNLIIDWNQDGLWGGTVTCPNGTIVPEHVLVNFPIPNPHDGPLAPLNPPGFVIGPQPGYVWARFTISEQPVMLPWSGKGVFEDGESEDYLLWIEEEPREFDWGDLPAPYPTLAANNGPNHLIVPNMALGAGVDSEPDGQPDPGAMGDDNDTIYPPPNDDEDGITFVTNLIPGQQAIIDVTNNMAAGGVGYLEGWIDFNNDGSFAEAGDQIFFGSPLSPFPINFNSFFVNVPFTATPGPTFARFRFSSNPAGYGWTGPAPDGEVEDYAVRVDQPSPIMACCLPDGTCVDTTYMNCVMTLMGDPQGPGTSCATVVCHPIKWAQPPIFNPESEHPECFFGWDEPSIYDGYQIVADDWLCIDEGPIADIHFWGSYANWEDLAPPPDAPALFHIGLWTDQPAGPGGTPPSHPQTMIWEWIVPRSDLNEHPVACDYEPDHMQTPDGCYRYDFDIPPDQWFFQEPGPTIYWISISAIYDPVDCACNLDFSGDGMITSLDAARLAQCLAGGPGMCTAQMDVNCDGVINTRDTIELLCGINCWPVHHDLAICHGMCCRTAPPPVEHVWGWKTRPHFYNDFAQAVANPTELMLGNEYVEGRVVESGWDMSFVITTREPEPPLVPKWSQLPHPAGEGFDARSDIGLLPPVDLIKWQQLSNVGLPGLHAHDDNVLGQYLAMTLADQWICDGGLVTKLVWYGNYELDSFGNEKRFSGINYFNVEIYDDDGMPQPFCLPRTLLWSGQASFAGVNETWTGLLNSENCRIYRYEYVLPQPFDQQIGQIYWLAVGAIANDANAAAIWRWQDGLPNPNVCFAAMRTLPSSPNWSTLQGTELAFEIIQTESPPPPMPNRVVADDFVSDGRPIEAVRWWGSYIDERFAPLEPVEPYIIDGWLISFHHAMPDAVCPPDAMAGDDPTALGIYFAPAPAVTIVPMGYADCLGHDVYGYVVDLSRCCLICAEPDPRNPGVLPPAQPDEFLEVRGFEYWIDVQAVAGVQWVDLTDPACTPIYTGHIPSDLAGLEGHFWGWHTSPGPDAPCSPMNDACFGFLSAPSVAIPSNDCPEYNNWQKQAWECDLPEQSVQMAFELLTTTPDACATCPGDMDGNGVINGLDIHGFVQCLIDGSLSWTQCACADVDCSKTVTMADIDAFVALLLSGAAC
ncbi:MAG: hypothetical protein H6818_03040 [Phycisphaerales bacterium]|nr:hypothetical protein [Phycisphaerales bacterium]MCB9864643.1 hypothetical protein [Phycisphaerales bacterium]